MDANWTTRFLGLAEHIARWSKDPSSRVGAVIVRPDKTIASVGYNGFPRGVDDRLDRIQDRSSKLLFTLHAEMNAILAAKEPLKECSLFVWPFQPCAQCAGAIIQSGITQVFCPGEHPDRWAESFKAASQMFREAGVVVRHIR
jgi:dCMP deaminase